MRKDSERRYRNSLLFIFVFVLIGLSLLFKYHFIKWFFGSFGVPDNIATAFASYKVLFG